MSRLILCYFIIKSDFFPFRFSPKARHRNAALIRQLPRRQEFSIQFETLSKPLLHEGFQTSFSLFLARLCLRVCAANKRVCSRNRLPKRTRTKNTSFQKTFWKQWKSQLPKTGQCKQQRHLGRFFPERLSLVLSTASARCSAICLLLTPEAFHDRRPSYLGEKVSTSDWVRRCQRGLT